MADASDTPLGWSARREPLDGGGQRLSVEGVVVTPNPGYLVELTRQPDRDAATLRLALKLTAQEGMWIQVLKARPAQWSAEGDFAAFDRVEIIGPDGETTRVPIGPAP